MTSQKRKRVSSLEGGSSGQLDDSRLSKSLNYQEMTMGPDYVKTAYAVKPLTKQNDHSLIEEYLGNPRSLGHRTLPDGLRYSKSTRYSDEQKMINNYFNLIDKTKQQINDFREKNPSVLQYLSQMDQYRRFVRSTQRSILSEKQDMNIRYDINLLQENQGFIKRVIQMLQEYNMSEATKRIKLDDAQGSIEDSWEHEFARSLQLIKSLNSSQKHHFKDSLSKVKSLPRSQLFFRRFSDSSQI